MFPASTAGQVAARTAAATAPIVTGVALLAGGLIGAFVSLSDKRDKIRDRRVFLRKMALDHTFSAELLVFYQQNADPIGTALKAIADPTTPDDMRSALRKAVACVL